MGFKVQSKAMKAQNTFDFQTNVLNLLVRLKKHSVPDFFFICFEVLLTTKFRFKVLFASKL
jgi:hypothetical protein